MKVAANGHRAKGILRERVLETAYAAARCVQTLHTFDCGES